MVNKNWTVLVLSFFQRRLCPPLLGGFCLGSQQSLNAAIIHTPVETPGFLHRYRHQLRSLVHPGHGGCYRIDHIHPKGRL